MIQTKNPPAGGADGSIELSSYGGVDCSESAPEIAPAQADFLLAAIKALSAEEIRADLENIPLTLAASGWRSTAALLTHAAGCADAGDFLNAELNRQRAREQFIAANDAFRQYQEARAAASAWIGAEAFLRAPP
jgi:hypothetical protein